MYMYPNKVQSVETNWKISEYMSVYAFQVLEFYLKKQIKDRD